MILRDYQERIVEEVMAAALSEEAPGICVQAGTGAGKTVIGAEIARRLLSHGIRSHFFCHRKEIIEQTERKLYEAGVLVGPLGCEVKSVQAEIKTEKIGSKAVIIDECHHYTSNVWGALVGNYANAIRVGLSATPTRGDGRALTGFSRMVQGPPIGDLVAGGYLVPTICYSSKEAKCDPVSAIQRVPWDPPAVMFCGSIKTAKELAARLGKRAQIVSDECSAEEREAVLRAFKNREFDILLNKQILTEGWDMPEVNTVILQCLAGCPGAYLQRVGRGKRSSPGKTHMTVIDCASNIRTHGMPDDPRQWTLSGKTGKTLSPLATLRQCRQCGYIDRAWAECPRCGWVYLVEEKPTKQLPDGTMVLVESASDVLEIQRATYAALRRVATAKGYKEHWADKVFQSKFKQWPSEEVKC